MKQSVIVTLVLFLFGMTASAQAAELTLSSANILQNGTASLDIGISGGTEPYAGVNARILLPKSISVTGLSRGALLASGSFTSDYQTFSDSANTVVTVIACSGTVTFTASSPGVLLTLNLKADSAATAGAYTVQFAAINATPMINSRYALAKADGSASIIPSPQPGTITVEKDADIDSLGDSWETRYFGNLNQTGSGDYDKDGFTNKQEYDNGTNPAVKDAFTLADVITVLKANSGISVSAANLDISGNGKTGMEDAVYILQKIAGKR